MASDFVVPELAGRPFVSVRKLGGGYWSWECFLCRVGGSTWFGRTDNCLRTLRNVDRHLHARFYHHRWVLLYRPKEVVASIERGRSLVAGDLGNAFKPWRP